MKVGNLPSKLAAAVLFAVLFFSAGTVTAQITQVENLFGKYTLSVDGCENNNGSGAAGSCPIVINKPANATLYKAYMVATITAVDGGSFPNDTPVRINTTAAYAGSIGPVLSVQASANGTNKTRYANVTTSLTAFLNSLPTGASTLYLMPDNNQSNDPSSGLEGRTLLVIWNDPNGSDKVISIALGSTTSLPPTTFTVNTPALNLTPPASTAIAGLGINFSTGTDFQTNNLSVNTTLLTNVAGGFDDGVTLANGDLFTIGDDGDLVGTTTEKYDIKPALVNASTSYTVTFENVLGHAEDYCSIYYSVVSDAFQSGTITGTLYNDVNTNLIFNAGEGRLPANITVNLYRDIDGVPGLNPATDQLVATTVTDANGNYTFTNITIGTSYIVQVDTADTDIPSVYTIETVNPVLNVASVNGDTTTVDFGFVSPCAIPAVRIANSATVCANQSYQLPSGAVAGPSGIYLDTIRTSSGSCDSIIYTINLLRYTITVSNAAVHICPSQTYQLPWGGTVSTEGVYADTIRNLALCDSVINTVRLFVDRVVLLNRDVHICPNQTYTMPSGTVVNAQGIYLDTLRSRASCDSIINTIHLFIDQAALQSATVHICPGQTYRLPAGRIVNTEALYTDTLKSRASCDSIITATQLFVDQASFKSVTANICSDQSYQLPSGVSVNATGTYMDTLRGQASCDSIITTINLVVNNTSASYHLDSIYNGQDYILPSGVVVSTGGIYQSVLVNSLGCDSVVTTELKIKISIADCLILKNAFTPNGDGVNDYWVLSRFNCFRRLKVDVYNRYGSLVFHSDDYKNEWNGKYKNKDLPDATYYYFIQVLAYDGREAAFRGDVTILR